MTVITVIAVIIILLLLYCVRIVYSFKLENFSISAKVCLKTPFKKELFDTNKPKKKTKETEGKKDKNKFDLETIKKLKPHAVIVISQLCGIIKRHFKVSKMETFIKLALEDPMENGIAYGVVSGVFNIGTAILMDKCKVKNIDLKIESDFESGEGFILETSGVVKVRPVMLLMIVIFNFKLIKAIKEILIIIKREDKENG